jgi:hypothetical protein
MATETRAHAVGLLPVLVLFFLASPCGGRVAISHKHQTTRNLLIQNDWETLARETTIRYRKGHQGIETLQQAKGGKS